MIPSVRVPLRRSRGCLLRRAGTDAEAFAAFYDRYLQRVLVFHTRRVLDAQVAMDLTAETFAKAFELRTQFRGDSAEAEQAWLFAVARSELTGYWRRGHAERAAVLRLGVEVPSLTEPDIERIEDLAELRDIAAQLELALRALPPEQTDAVRLRVLQERSYAEVAEALQVSQQVARSRVSRGLRALAAGLVAEPVEDVA